jgi:hypothetical protein
LTVLLECSKSDLTITAKFSRDASQCKAAVLDPGKDHFSICMQFRFKATKHGRDPTHIYFAKEESIMELNFDTEETRELVQLQEPLSRQPEFFYMNDE